MARYAKIADDLRAQITSGTLRPGDPLPTEGELQAAYGVSVSTARRALQALGTEGLIDSHRGRRSVVRPQSDLIRMMTLYVRDPTGVLGAGWRDEPQATVVPAPEETATRLGIEPGEPVSRVCHRWYMGRELIAVSTGWEPLRHTRGTVIEVPDLTGGTDVITRFALIGVPVRRVDTRTRTRMPTPHEVRLLNVPPGVPVYDISQTFLAREGRVHMQRVVVRGDRVEFVNSQEV